MAGPCKTDRQGKPCTVRGHNCVAAVKDYENKFQAKMSSKSISSARNEQIKVWLMFLKKNTKNLDDPFLQKYNKHTKKISDYK